MVADGCAGVKPIVAIIKQGVFPIIQIGIPILLILFGSIDLGKAVISQDDKEIKGATGKLIKRALMALAVFFVVYFVHLVFSWIGTARVNDGTGISDNEFDWFTCWNSIGGNNPNNGD